MNTTQVFIFQAQRSQVHAHVKHPGIWLNSKWKSKHRVLQFYTERDRSILIQNFYFKRLLYNEIIKPIRGRMDLYYWNLRQKVQMRQDTISKIDLHPEGRCLYYLLNGYINGDFTGTQLLRTFQHVN